MTIQGRSLIAAARMRGHDNIVYHMKTPVTKKADNTIARQHS
jgi:hypothetical protein